MFYFTNFSCNFNLVWTPSEPIRKHYKAFQVMWLDSSILMLTMEAIPFWVSIRQLNCSCTGKHNVGSVVGFYLFCWFCCILPFWVHVSLENLTKLVSPSPRRKDIHICKIVGEWVHGNSTTQSTTALRISLLRRCGLCCIQTWQWVIIYIGSPPLSSLHICSQLSRWTE